MMTRIGKFKCCVLRDAMRVAVQFNSKARMRTDETGIHIGAVNSHNTSVIWVDIPAETFEAQWSPEDPKITEEIGIDCEKLCRMLYAYEEPSEVRFSLEYGEGAENFMVTSGEEGTLRGYQASINDIKKTPDMGTVRTAYKLYTSCEKDATILRDWLNRIKDDIGTHTVMFMYDETIGNYPVEIIPEFPDIGNIVMDHPVARKGAPKLFTTLMDRKLIHEAIAPECIDGTIQILFGKDAPIYMATKVNGCTVTMAIAPRIEP
ncbi:MAG: hypothetical protein ACXQTR_06325 [Candidatus Methanospirareceae archaeon]